MKNLKKKTNKESENNNNNQQIPEAIKLNIGPHQPPSPVETDDDCFTDIQDEFTKKMEEKIKYQKQKKEEYELSRFTSLQKLNSNIKD